MRKGDKKRDEKMGEVRSVGVRERGVIGRAHETRREG